MYIQYANLIRLKVFFILISINYHVWFTVIEICIDNEQKLIKCSENGKNNKWLQNIPFKTDSNRSLGKYVI